MNSPIFSLSPFYAAADKTLGHAAHRVLTLLCGFADPEGLCFPSRKMLCHLTGIENSNLSKYINVLCRKGYLEKVNASGNRYKIIGFKDKQWPMVECGNDYHHENQQHGNSYHENISCGNSYHEDGNSYHEDGNDYHKTGDSVVIITNRTDQKINRPIEQTNEQTILSCAPEVPQKSSTTKKGRSEKAKDLDLSSLVLPDWLPAEPWQQYILHRQRIKKPMSVYAAEITIRELNIARENKWSPEELLNNAITNGYQGCVYDKHKQPKLETQIFNQNPTFNTGGNNGYQKLSPANLERQKIAAYERKQREAVAALETCRIEKDITGFGNRVA